MVHIIDRGRGPEVEGTRVTVYLVMDYLRAGDPPARIAAELALSEEQVQEAIAYINAQRDEVEPAYEAILKRVSQPNPDWIEAGSAKTWDELRRRIEARSTGEPGACSSWPITTSRGRRHPSAHLESAENFAWLDTCSIRNRSRNA